MDNHLGDWLYYIVILVVAGISMLNGMNKKKRQQQEPDSSPFPPEEILLPPPPVRMQQKKKTPPPVPERTRKSSFLSSRIPDEGERMFTPEPFVFNEEKDSGWMEKLDLTDTEAFRKAIIYSEILNRKY
jgi:hypothetical protein